MKRTKVIPVLALLAALALVAGPRNLSGAASAMNLPAAAPEAGVQLNAAEPRQPVLIAPPLPRTTRPVLPRGYRAPRVQPAPEARAAAPAEAVTPPAQARSWGPGGGATTLVVYDTTGEFGWLGELYALAASTLASHFGRITAEPVTSYVPGQINDFTSTIYVGSTYNEPVPTAFLSDVLSTTKPVIWAGSNVWQLSGEPGSALNQSFQTKYGWDPSTSNYDTADNPTSITYKGQEFSRNPLNGANVLAPHITGTNVTVLSTAACEDANGAAVSCGPLAQSGGTTFPWAIRSANLTYVGEIPFTYLSESDRYLIFSDLLFHSNAPLTYTRHRALVRLEDVDPTVDPATLRQFADYLASENVPFTVGVIPQWTDPNGVYNNGQPSVVTLADRPEVVAALRYMESKGGTILQHGTTHQYSNVANPYNGASGDDAEFFRARCATTQQPPYTFVAPCQNDNWVIWTGTVPDDSVAWARDRVQAGRSMFTAAGLAAPTIFETPHYFGSPAAYAGMGAVYRTRYERELFVSGQLSGGPLNYGRLFGQFFPYAVTDIHGQGIIPENLGNYEPEWSNNNPPRLPADMIASARLNLAVTDGFASFFFHPSYELSALQETVTGVKSLGYSFVAPGTVAPK